MKQITLLFGAIYGMTAVLFGAFGAHALKKIISAEKITSFETGVRYQMYHALLLLIIGAYLPYITNLEKWTSILIITGVFLFSFSIYGLSLQDYFDLNLKFLGPITPLGGLLLLIGWGLLILNFKSIN